MVMTTLGAGVHTGEPGVACSAIGSTGVHMRAVRSDAVHLNEERSGYVICLPAENMVTQVQTNMSAPLNIDWVLSLSGDHLAQKATMSAMPIWSSGSMAGWRLRSRRPALSPLYL